MPCRSPLAPIQLVSEFRQPLAAAAAEPARRRWLLGGLRAVAGIASGSLAIPLAWAADELTPLKLASGVSLSVPSDWMAVSNGQRIALDANLRSSFEDTGITVFEGDTTFTAHHFTGRDQFDASLTVRFTPDVTLSQTQSADASPFDVQSLDGDLHRNIRNAARNSSIKLIQWIGTSKRNVNGRTMFVSDYLSGPLRDGGNFFVRFVRVFAMERSFTLTFSYREDSKNTMWRLSERVIGSVRWS